MDESITAALDALSQAVEELRTAAGNPLYRVPDAARYLAISRRLLDGAIAAGEIEVVRFGRAVRLSRNALDDFAARHTVGSPLVRRKPRAGLRAGVKKPGPQGPGSFLAEWESKASS